MGLTSIIICLELVRGWEPALMPDVNSVEVGEYCWYYRKGDSVGYDYGNVGWAKNN